MMYFTTNLPGWERAGCLLCLGGWTSAGSLGMSEKCNNESRRLYEFRTCARRQAAPIGGLGRQHCRRDCSAGLASIR